MVMFKGSPPWHEQWDRLELDEEVLILAKHEVVLPIIIEVGFLLLVIIIIDAC